MAVAAQPWDRRDDESGPAHRAFLIYRDLGPTRSLDRAGLAIAPPVPGAQSGRKRGATGRIREWFKRWDWSERARAWDAHQAAIAQEAVEKEAAAAARRWAARREEELELEFEVGKQLLLQSRLWAYLPVVERVVNDQGEMTRVTALPPENLRAAASVARQGADLARGAIEVGLAIETAVAAERARAEAEARPPGDPSEGMRRHDAWQQEKLRSLITMDWIRPPGQPQAPEPEPPTRGRNGSGIPPAPAGST